MSIILFIYLLIIFETLRFYNAFYNNKKKRKTTIKIEMVIFIFTYIIYKEYYVYTTLMAEDPKL